jgi:chromosome segregation ATPase
MTIDNEELTIEELTQDCRLAELVLDLRQTVAEQSEALTDLRTKVETLLTETPEERATREQAIWNERRRRTAIDSDIRTKRSRLAQIDSDLAEHVPWLEFLTAQRADVKAKLEEARHRVADTPGDGLLVREVEELEDTLWAIEGARNWRQVGGDLVQRTTAAGWRPVPGYTNPLEGRFMLATTMRTVAALRAEREVVQRELDQLS